MPQYFINNLPNLPTMTKIPALELTCQPLHIVRIGMVGLGQRGQKTLRRYGDIEGAEICCIADLNPARIAEAQAILRETGRPEAKAFTGANAWKELCLSAEVDVVYICTDWYSHTEIAVCAMQAGKHAAIEVPAATSVKECWKLVHTAEQTRRHCFMTENCCYDHFSLSVQEMADEGLFGEITHCEGAYIHDLRTNFGLNAESRARRSWMEQSCVHHNGNPYPTHGLGPIGWLLGLHRGDRMDYLVSMSAEGHGTDHLIGRVNTTLIRTLYGRSILLQLDITTERPYSRLQTVCGTNGYAQKYPLPTLKTTATPTILQGQAALDEARRHMSSHAARLWAEGRIRNVENEMNFAMDSRFIYCLRNGLPLDIDVYDAAEWSCISELSQQSVAAGSRPVPIPDFTGGRWESAAPHRMYA